MSGAWDGRPRLLAVRPQLRTSLSQLKSHLQLAPLHRNPIGNRSLNPRPQIPQRPSRSSGSAAGPPAR